MIGRLPGIAVAAAAEHHDEVAAHEGPQRRERLLERVRLMRVIDEDRRALAAADAFETAGRAFELFERREDRAGRAARGDAKTGGDKRVRHLKRTGKRKKERESLRSMGNFDPRRKILGRAFEETQRRAFRAGRDDAQAARFASRDDLCRDIAVGIDNGGWPGASKHSNNCSFAAR